MATKRFSRMLVLVKPESTYGVDAGPTAAANAMLMTDVAVEMQFDTEVAPKTTTYLGAQQQTLYNLRGQLTGTVELAGSGAAGTAPAYGVLDRACGFAAVGGDFSPASDGHESVTVYAYFDDAWHKLLGARGDWSENWSTGAPKATYTLTGFWTEPAATDFDTLAPDYSAFKTPLPISGDNTSKITLHGWETCGSELTLNGGNQIKFDSIMGCTGIYITDREITGNIVVTPADLGTFNPWAVAAAGALGNFSVQHGSAAGAIVKRTAPKVQVMPPTRQDRDGLLMWNIPLRFIPDAGDDELVKGVA